MITRWLDRRREAAAIKWHKAREVAHLLGNTPSAAWTDSELARARRRLNRWSAALDLWTGTR